jgi:hypothetical protein
MRLAYGIAFALQTSMLPQYLKQNHYEQADPFALSSVDNLDPAVWRTIYLRLCCALFGHRVDNHLCKQIPASSRHCRCGVAFLQEDDSETRIGHIIRCFLLGHHYTKIGQRDGHNEYVCSLCGHPLLLEVSQDPYQQVEAYRKRVRYRCNLFGHRVHKVGERNEFSEYACRCGHSFLKREKLALKIRHPLICLFAGHYIHFLGRRNGYAEYLCRGCGHTFCFVAKDAIA